MAGTEINICSTFRRLPRIHSSDLIVQHIHITALWFQLFFAGQRVPAVVFLFLWVWPRFVRQGGGVLFLVEQKAKGDGRAWTSRSRSGARVKRALPDGFLIPLLLSRSSAICDVKKPNLIIRPGQVSALAHSRDGPAVFPAYVHVTATQILLKTLKNKPTTKQSGLCCTWI